MCVAVVLRAGAPAGRILLAVAETLALDAGSPGPAHHSAGL